MAYFPFFIDIDNQKCLIVGGGTVAYRKVLVLKDYGPRIHVVAAEISGKIRDLAERKDSRIVLEQREFEDRDLENVDFVVAATEDGALNRRISHICRERRIPVNVVDVQDACSFIFPALVRDGDITVGISTGGSSPTIAQYLKAKFREDIPEGFGDLAVQLGSYRQMVKEQVPEIALRTEIFREMVDAGIAGGCFLSREEAQGLIHRKKREYQENREDQGTRENQEKRQVRIGTRKSELAVVQTRLAAAALEEKNPWVRTELVTRETLGDQILNKPLLEFGGKGVFVSEFEEAMKAGTVDLAVHSAKDMPMELEVGLTIAAVLEREDPRDVIVTCRGTVLEGKKEIVVGTSSPRRAVQIEALGPEFWPGAKVSCQMLRGNVNTRLRKLEEGGYDAIILAAAGLKRLGFLDGRMDGRFAFQFLDCETFIPAGGQGILAVEGRADDEALLKACRAVEDPDARICLETERKVLRLLNAGCHEPIGVYCRPAGEGQLELSGICGRQGAVRRVRLTGGREQAEEMAVRAAAVLEGREGEQHGEK